MQTGLTRLCTLVATIGNCRLSSFAKQFSLHHTYCEFSKPEVYDIARTRCRESINAFGMVGLSGIVGTTSLLSLRHRPVCHRVRELTPLDRSFP